MSARFRSFIKRNFPVTATKVFNIYASLKYQNKDARHVFQNIYNNNSWEGVDSVSGAGSDIKQTEEISRHLPQLISEYNIQSMLDIPCGDHFWINKLNLDIQYIGADIVSNLIERNKAHYEASNKTFLCMDIIKDNLPDINLIFCRDCFIHFSYDDIFKSIENIKKSGAQYLMTTTFPEKENRDIATGGWRMLNLEAAPFNFPEPLICINEKCDEGEAYKTKSMALWKVSDL